jgi:hypothetical protein
MAFREHCDDPPAYDQVTATTAGKSATREDPPSYVRDTATDEPPAYAEEDLTAARTLELFRSSDVPIQNLENPPDSAACTENENQNPSDVVPPLNNQRRPPPEFYFADPDGVEVADQNESFERDTPSADYVQIPANACALYGCRNTADMRCERCGSPYCSKRCQAYDYPSHKVLCRQFVIMESRPVDRLGDCPGDRHLRALLFPQNDQSPRLIWLKFRPVPTFRYVAADLSRPRTVIKNNDYPVLTRSNGNGHLSMRHNYIDGCILLNKLHFWFIKDFFRVRRLDHSKSILASTHGLLANAWKGPMIVTAEEGIQEAYGRACDFKLEDLRHVVGFLSAFDFTYNWDVRLVRRNPNCPPSGWVHGVRLTAVSDKPVLGEADIKQVHIPRCHPMFPDIIRNGPLTRFMSEVALRLKLRLYLWWSSHRRPTVNPRREYQTQLTDNWIASCLMFSVGEQGNEIPADFGDVVAPFRENVGTIIIFREDRGPLLESHMDVLSLFCTRKLFLKLSMYHSGHLNHLDVLEDLTIAKFGAYYEAYGAYLLSRHYYG